MVLEEVSGGWVPESKASKADQIAAFFRFIIIPDNRRETVKKYVDMFWETQIPRPYYEKGFCGLYNPLTNFCIAKDNIIDVIQNHI